MFFGAVDEHIRFRRYSKEPIDINIPNFPENNDKNNHVKTISLFSKYIDFNIFQQMPKNFTITTKNGSCKFNKDMIEDASSVISDCLKENPQTMQYNLGINDESNVLDKFRRLFEGEIVNFNEDDLLISQKITKILNLTRCPDFLKPESLKKVNSSEIGLFTFYPTQISQSLDVQIDINSFKSFIQRKIASNFTIVTNKKRYRCNIYGAIFSDAIQKLIINDSSLKTYVYNFEDEFGEFESICNLFNFQNVDINKDNVDFIKEIAEDLQIQCILGDINKFIEEKESLSKAIDEQQTIVETIDEMFDLLHHIDKNGVKTVKNKILQSKWSKKEEDVQELVAFIIQVAKTDFNLHKFLAELIVQLNDESNETNKLDILQPFLVSKIINFTLLDSQNDTLNKIINRNHLSSHNNSNSILPFNMAICSFTYNLLKSGIIQKSEIKEKLKNSANISYEIIYWFLPEILEIYPLNVIQNMTQKDTNCNYLYTNFRSNNLIRNINQFLSFYLPDKIDLYKQMRDNGEPNDALTKALRIDDVDTLQSILSKSKSELMERFIPFNIYENYIDNGETKLIDYAAAYGSIKCFKYLLLNHCKVTRTTFEYAIYGGNIEIIKIVDQQITNEHIKSNINFPPFMFNHLNDGDITLYPFPAIMKHQNDIFDWLLDEKLQYNAREFYYKYFQFAAECGNAHAMIEIIEKGFDFTDNQDSIYNIFGIASCNGFYHVTKLLFNIVTRKNLNIHFNPYISIYYGSLAIYKLYEKSLDQKEINQVVIFAIYYEYTSFVKYFFENISKRNYIISHNSLSDLLIRSASLQTDKMFNLVLEEIKITIPDFLKNNKQLILIIGEVCKSDKTEITQIIADLILDLNPNYKFNKHFIDAAMSKSLKMCEFFIKREIPINYETLALSSSKLFNLNDELFSLIAEKMSPEARDMIFSCLLPAIENKNKVLVDFLLKEGAQNDEALIKAVQTNDPEIVDIVLKYNSKPNFVNAKFSSGTALAIAVKSENVKIVERLFSIPGINPFIYGINSKNPLLEAVKQKKYDMIRLILNSINENDIQSWQINRVISTIIETQNLYNGDIKENKVHKERDLCNKFDSQDKKDILRRLAKFKGIDINYHYKFDTFLTYACIINDKELVENILQHDNVDINLYESIMGNTPLMIAISNNNVEIAELLLKNPNINVNHQNFNQKTALTLATQQMQGEIIDLILNNEKFDPEQSRLNYAFYFANQEIAKKFLSNKSLDVNYSIYEQSTDIEVSPKIETSLTSSVKSSNFEKVEMIINHPSFNKSKSKLRIAIMDSIKTSNDLFEKLVKLADNDINICDFRGISLLNFALNCNNQELFDRILYDPNFDSKKSNIVKCFVDSYTSGISNSFMLMNKLLNYDIEHDHLIDFKKLLPNGLSFFTTIRSSIQNIGEIVKFLLDHGADPNIPDEKGVFPLERAIEHKSYEFVVALLDSNKIDFTRKIQIKYNISDFTQSSMVKYFEVTYLHLAANSTDSILKEFLDRKLIDINITDDLGNTPLFYAAIRKDVNIINLLFENTNLDYLHRNYEGKDALSICCNGKCNKIIKNRGEYLAAMQSRCFNSVPVQFFANAHGPNVINGVPVQFNFYQ